MKTLKRFFMIIASALLLFAGCAKVESPYNSRIPVNSKGEYAITFTKTPAAKASVSTWSTFSGYDKFQLFTWNEDEAIMDPFHVVGEGDEYKYDGVEGQTLQYFKKQYDTYNFIGIIPEDASTTLTDTTVTVTGIESFVVDDKRVETDIIVDSPKEFLYAQAAVAKADYGNNVTLPFKHGNALLKLSFKSDKNDTELLDYTPTTPAVPASDGTPDTVKYVKKATKFIDELVAGSEVQVAIGFYGASSPKLTETQPNPLYVGSDNTSNGWLAKTWLLSIKDAVNAQFVYYRLNSVVNSTSKTETTEDWESAASNKNIFMMKLADGVDKAEFAAGNDVFWNALVAHETDWFGGSPKISFKQMFVQAYADGWRVVRINVSDANANQVLVFLSSNIETSTQVCTITPGTPATPGSPEIPGLTGIRVFSADTTTTGLVHIAHTLNAKAVVTPATFAWEDRVTATDSIQFSLPATTVLASEQWSPTTFYAIPSDTDLNYFVVKFSYKYDGTTVYDVRVPLKLPVGGLVAGKYYHYIINITSTGNGTNHPTEAETDKDDIEIVDNPIVVTVSTTDYTEGTTTTVTI